MARLHDQPPRGQWDHESSHAVATFVLERSGTILRPSPAAVRLLGLAAPAGTTSSSSPGEQIWAAIRTAARTVSDLSRVKATLDIAGEPRTILVSADQLALSQDIAAVGCFAVEISAEEGFAMLFQHLPIGVYRLDRDDRVIAANSALVGMLGYARAEDILGAPVSSFYAIPRQASDLRSLIERDERVINEPTTLITKQETKFIGAVSAHLIRTPDGDYGGREGTITDITTEAMYRRIVDAVPIGLYHVAVDAGREKIVHCNANYARLLGFSTAAAAIGASPKDFFETPAEYDRFIWSLDERTRRGTALTGFHAHIAAPSTGQNRTVEITCKAETDASGAVIGRVGAVRDITAEEHNLTQLEFLKRDIGSLVHSFGQASVAIGTTLSALRELLAIAPGVSLGAEDAVPLEVEADVVAALADRIVAILDERSASPSAAEALRLLASTLRFTSRHQSVNKTLTYEEACRSCLQKLGAMVEGAPKELVRQFRRSAWNLARRAALRGIDVATRCLEEIQSQADHLRENVDNRSGSQPGIESIDLQELLAEVISNQQRYARSRRIQVNVESSGTIAVRADRVAVRRALTNLINNAIKYSWYRASVDAHVVVRSWQDGALATVQVENWGVPITRDEIKTGLIFEVGYRGRYSEDRARAGTGLGLPDVRRTARSHGGDVMVDSVPAGSGGNDDYDQPFKTTVTLTFHVGR